MDFFLLFFIASILALGKYGILVARNLFNTPPTRLGLKYYDEIIIITSFSYFLGYILT
jgi:hypothetical protein